MRIGINALYLIPGGVGGTEIFLRNLLTSLSLIDRTNEYVIYTDSGAATGLIPDAPNFRQSRQPINAKLRPVRILWEQLALPFAIRSDKLDVLLNAGFTSPLWAHCPQVTYIHDLQYKCHPEYFRPPDLLFWKLLVGSSIRNSTRLVTLSIAAQRDIQRFFNRSAAVAPLGVEQRFFDMAAQRKSNDAQPYILCVSTLHPHKNIELLIQAYAEFRNRHPEINLVLAGMRGFNAQPVEQLIQQLNLSQHVRITGWISREEIYSLYAGASSFVFPSLFEGFGIPLVEALAAGIPSICADLEPMKSNAQGAALTFDAISREALTQCLLTITEDQELRARLRAEGPRQAQQFRWERTAAVTLAELTIAADLPIGS